MLLLVLWIWDRRSIKSKLPIGKVYASVSLLQNIGAIYELADMLRWVRYVGAIYELAEMLRLIFCCIGAIYELTKFMLKKIFYKNGSTLGLASSMVQAVPKNRRTPVQSLRLPIFWLIALDKLLTLLWPWPCSVFTSNMTWYQQHSGLGVRCCVT